MHLALLESIISYTIVILGNASKFAINPLIITLNSLFQFILSKSYDFHANYFYGTFNIRNLNRLYLYTLNIRNHIFNVDLNYYSTSHNYQTRLKQSVNLNIPCMQ